MTTPKSDADTYRLRDIVVEEVSLVDRAANKHRFLIVKRSEPMKENAIDKSDNTEANSTATPEAQPSDNLDDEVSGEAGNSALLNVIVEALERMTDTVESLGTIGDGEAALALGETAAELRVLADRLAQAAGTASPAVPAHEDNLATVLASARATLQQIGSLIAASKTTKAKAKPAAGGGAEPADESANGDEEENDDGGKKKTAKRGPVAAPSVNDGARNDELRKGIASIAESVKKVVEGLRDQAQRLSKLEKRFGLPNSAAVREQASRRADDEVGWPMDLNRPFDRENVDKAVSFHDA
jgi:hypothetical protein